MRNYLPAALSALLLAVPAQIAAQKALQLRWELQQDVVQGDQGRSRAVFTLTNRDTKPLAPNGWAIYFNALHSAQQGSVEGGFTIEDLAGELHRIVQIGRAHV